MSENLENKKQVVEDIKAKIDAAKSIVVVSFSGLTVAEDTDLRTEMRKNNIDYKVLKNTLVKRAFDDKNIKGFDADLNGPTAVAFGSDETGAAKVLVDAAKKYNEKIVIKSGYVEGNHIDVNGVKSLASIPSREGLYAMLAGALIGVPRALAIALNAVAEQKAQ